jgi:predicted nuclease of predicted toxin-antitoxin system
MKFLIDANLPRPTADLVRRFGHEVRDVRDIGLGDALDEIIAAYAKNNAICLLTGDFDFADVRDYPPDEYSGIVVLALPDNANREFILWLVEAFLKQQEILDLLPGRLAIVDRAKIRLRPKP